MAGVRRRTMSEVSEILERPKTKTPGNRKSASGKLMNVGFIGLGHMGAGMAANLLKAGHRVTVYNRTPAKADALVAQGAQRAADIADACRGEAFITMRANDEAVETAVFGSGGVMTSLAAGALHISSSTISVA